MKYKRILVAVDGSNTSNLALQEAIQLAKDLKASLRIIYVIDEAVVKGIEACEDFETLWNAYKEDGQDLLDRINENLKQEKIDFETRLVVLKHLEGHLAEKIITEAQDWHADLLVIGTHGRHGISRFFLGSVAERVLRLATIPVLLMRGE